jgi:hypothetical protein
MISGTGSARKTAVPSAHFGFWAMRKLTIRGPAAWDDGFVVVRLVVGFEEGEWADRAEGEREGAGDEPRCPEDAAGVASSVGPAAVGLFAAHPDSVTAEATKRVGRVAIMDLFDLVTSRRVADLTKGTPNVFHPASKAATTCCNVIAVASR